MSGRKTDMPIDANTALATLTPTALKRGLSVSILMVLGALLIFISAARPPDTLLLQGFLLGLGGLVLWLGESMRRATALGLILYSDRLEDSNGRLICWLKDVQSVERGTFAFKPSHGFSVRTIVRGPAHWAPGLWWQMGRRIGIGGVTPAGPAKFMAELISSMIVGQEMP